MKKLVKELFKFKTQKDIDKIDKKFLISIRNSLEIIEREKLSEVDRAFLDFYFNSENPKKYFSIEYGGKINEDKFKKFVRTVYKKDNLDGKNYVLDLETKRDFMSFVGWALTVGGYYDDW